MGQPPSGGCVLKLYNQPICSYRISAAAFGRLCVETSVKSKWRAVSGAAAFGRLCVETSLIATPITAISQPPSGGCVLKHQAFSADRKSDCAAAFGRLCVETSSPSIRRIQGAAAFGRLCVETISLKGGFYEI